jgi:pyruvate ferredoxin oxidoreductase alpha subunit
MEHRKIWYDTYPNVPQVIKEAFAEYEKLTGRRYVQIKTFNAEDADKAIVILGSSAGTARYAARKLKEKGQNMAVISLTQYRPFPRKELRTILEKFDVVAILDRSLSFGSPGNQLFMDVATSLYNAKKKPLLVNVVYGLGGRDFTPRHVEQVYQLMEEVQKRGEAPEEPIWVGLREA